MLRYKLFNLLITFKKLISSPAIRLLFILVLYSLSFAYAGDLGDIDDPSLADVSDTLIRIMNWLVFLVGIVFVAVLGYGAWKASTATGDPRALDSAKSTWTYALFGAIVVVGFFALFTIAAGWFGIKIGFTDIFGGIAQAIEDLTGVVTDPESYDAGWNEGGYNPIGDPNPE